MDPVRRWRRLRARAAASLGLPAALLALGSLASGHARARDTHCDGTPLLACPPGTTGPSCAWTCDASDSSGTSDCGFELYCHAEGRVMGLAGQRSVVFSVADRDELGVLDALVAFAVAHPWDLSLGSSVAGSDLELRPSPTQRAETYGSLSVHSFSQTYRGLPLLHPAGLVRVVVGPRGAIRVAGMLVDSAQTYADAGVTEPPQGSGEALLDAYARLVPGAAKSSLRVTEPQLVALPRQRAVGVMGIILDPAGGALARVVLQAGGSGAPQVLVLDDLVSEGLDDTVQIASRVVSADTEGFAPALLEDAIEVTSRNGDPLLGSIFDPGNAVQLSTTRGVALDLAGGDYYDLAQDAARVLDPGGTFLASVGSEYELQTYAHNLSGYFERVDEAVHQEVDGVVVRQWDSLNPAYGQAPSLTPPGQFVPRIATFANGNMHCAAGAGCAGPLGLTEGDETALAHPELLLRPVAGGNPEGLMSIRMSQSSEVPRVTLFAHEAGHAFDAFVGPGVTALLAPDCPLGRCLERCVEDTSDEALALGESVANGFAVQFLYQAFAYARQDPPCRFFRDFSTSGVARGPWGCNRPRLSVLARPENCEANTCDKPRTPGLAPLCCDPSEDPTCIDAHSGCASGFGGLVPTGRCTEVEGYRTASISHVFWQVLSDQWCDGTRDERACVPAGFPIGLDRASMLLEAWVFALKLNPASYRQLFDDMALHIGCSTGSQAFYAYRQIACAHGLLECDASLPTQCEVCGNGVAAGTEACDGSDLLGRSCSDLPGYEGELGCSDACTLDFSGCVAAESSTTADGSSGAGDVSGGSGTQGQGGSLSGGESGWGTHVPDIDEPEGAKGCACGVGGSAGWPSGSLFLLGLLPGLIRRRQRGGNRRHEKAPTV